MKWLGIAALGAATVLTSCSGSSSSGSKPAAIEVFGTWIIFEEGTQLCEAGGESFKDPKTDEYTAVLSQDGNEVKLKTGGDTYKGKMSGETLTWGFEESENVSDGTYKAVYSGKVTYNEKTGEFTGTATFNESGPGSLNPENGKTWTCKENLEITATCASADCGIKKVKNDG